MHNSFQDFLYICYGVTLQEHTTRTARGGLVLFTDVQFKTLLFIALLIVTYTYINTYT